MANAWTYGGDAEIDTNNVTAWSPTSVGIGTATADRIVVAAIWGFQNGTVDMTSVACTCDGVSGTQIATSGQAQESSVESNSFFFVFDQGETGGDTATFAWTWSGNRDELGMACWAGYGLPGLTPTDTALNVKTAAITATIDIPAGGTALLLSGSSSNPGFSGWTNHTTDHTGAERIAVSNRIFSAASYYNDTESDISNRVITCTWTSSLNETMCAVAFPASVYGHTILGIDVATRESAMGVGDAAIADCIGVDK